MPRPSQSSSADSPADAGRHKPFSLSVTGEELSLRRSTEEGREEQQPAPLSQPEQAPPDPVVDQVALQEAKQRVQTLEDARFHNDVVVTKRGRSLRMFLPESLGILLPDRSQLVWLAMLAAGLWTTFNWNRPVEVGASEREFLIERSEVQAVLPDPMLDYGREEWGGERHLLGDLRFSYSFGASLEEPVLRTEAELCRSEGRARRCFRKRSTVDVMVDWGLGNNDMSAWEDAIGVVHLDEERPLGDDSRVFRVETRDGVLGYGAVVQVEDRVLYIKLKSSQLNDEGFFSLVENAMGELRAHRP